MKIWNIINTPSVQPVKNTQNPSEVIHEKPGQPVDDLSFDAVKKAYGPQALKGIGAIECQTCAERTYVDGSDDPGVSFKTPGKISPEASAAVVMSHELEHVGREQNKAASEGREVVSQSVTLHSSICPECGKAYIAGGETKTSTQNKKEYKVPDDFVKGLFVDQNL